MMEVDEDDLLDVDFSPEEDSGGKKRSGLTPDMENVVKRRRLITVDNNLLETGSMNTRDEGRMNNLVGLTSYIIKLVLTRIQKLCADMLLMWEANKGNFLGFLLCLCAKL